MHIHTGMCVYTNTHAYTHMTDEKYKYNDVQLRWMLFLDMLLGAAGCLAIVLTAFHNVSDDLCTCKYVDVLCTYVCMYVCVCVNVHMYT